MTPVETTKRFGKWWRRWAGSIAFVSLIVLVGFGYAKQQEIFYNNCLRGNDLRHGLQQYFQGQIVQTEHTDLTTIFPNVPKSVLDALVAQSIKQLHYDVNVRFKSVDCETAYPRLI